MSAFFFILALFLIAGIAGSIFLSRWKQHLALQRAINTTLFRISLPRVFQKEDEQRKQHEKERIAAMEQFFGMFARLNEGMGIRESFIGPPHVTFEIAVPAVGEEIAFFVAVPTFFANETERAIHAIYDAARIERIKDYNIFHPYGVAAGATMSMRRHYALPFRTYMQLESDPLQSIATALSNLAPEGEGSSLQILIRPAPRKKRKAGIRIARQMQKSGHTFDRSRKELSFGYQMLRMFTSKPPPRSQQHMMTRQTGPMGPANMQMPDPNRPWQQDIQQPLTPGVQERIKGIEGKASKPLFEVNVRILAGADNVVQAEEVVDFMEVAFNQFDAPGLNGPVFLTHRKRQLRKLAFRYAFRMFDPKTKVYLNTEELTSLYHFPNVPLEAPKVTFLKAKPASPPARLPSEGVILGINNYRGIRTEARLSPDDRRRHLYVVGQTGTGKTTFLQDLIRQDILAGHGVAVIDPHGDLAETALSYVPAQRANDVIYFDASDTERPMGLNMLEWQAFEQKDFAVQEMIRIFEKLFPPEIIGPMFEHNMRNAMLTLMADPELPGTIVEIPRIFTDQTFAQTYIARVTDPLVRAFWEKEMAKTTEFHRSEMLGYLISKVGRFVENAMMRNIIGQTRSSFNLRDIMDNQKIFIANLSKGKIGEVNASLLGLILVGKMQIAALARADMPERDRKDFYLYIDEFQNFTTESIAVILSEARKYKLNLTLAHQFIAQLSDPIREAVFGNVGSLLSFRVGPKDAEFLVKQFAPIFDEQDLVNVDNFNAYVKLMVRGVTERAFNLETRPPEPGDLARAQRMREISRTRFGRARAEVEQEILERSQLGTPPRGEVPFTPGERNR